MILYPKFYLDSVKDIDMNLLKQNNIKGLILDVDNTLIDVEKKLIDGAESWCENLKKQGIKVCILSNTWNEEKAKSVAEKLNIPYTFFARKPSKSGFRKAQKTLEIENPGEIAAVGDQLFTDVIGANRVKMISILVKPVDERDYWYTKIKRPIEKWIIEKYEKNEVHHNNDEFHKNIKNTEEK